MKLLIIGGTRFVGLAITKAALERGHVVTVFHRGIAQSEDIKGAEHIIGDRDSDLTGLANTDLSWDVTIDVCAYRPNQVDALADALGSRGGKYVYISTISVYADDIPEHSAETGKLVDLGPLQDADLKSVPIDNKTYGPLKLLCEQRAQEIFGDILIVRPTYVLGPGDYTMRFPKWVQRISAGGVVTCPKPAENPFQYIDARDQATFVIDMVDKSVTGTFNSCVSPEISFGQLMNTIVATVGPPGVSLDWVDISEEDAKLASSEYPLCSGRSGSPMMTLDSAAAVQNGLKFRPLSDTITDTLSWLNEQSAVTGDPRL
jgi:2'-hydroxyisoflavone reductase